MPNLSIVFICTANICRSPMAEKLFQYQVAKHHLDLTISAASMGTWTTEGLPADPKAIAVMEERGLNLRDHRTQMLTETNLLPHHKILVMEHRHKEALQYEFPTRANRIFMLSEIIDDDFEIPDPYRKSIKQFRKTADLLNTIITTGFHNILQR